ncbi:Lrp/AsnC ligand binding domain-containing protein [Chloroflexota bacterium]
MTVKAFVLIETVVGKNKEVVTALKQLEGIKSVDTVTGPYDVIATIEREALNDIGNLITSRLYPVLGISRTMACLVVPQEAPQPRGGVVVAR